MPKLRELEAVDDAGRVARTVPGRESGQQAVNLAPRNPRDVLALQRLVGNKAVSEMMAARTGPTNVQRRKGSEAEETETEAPGETTEPKKKKKKSGLAGMLSGVGGFFKGIGAKWKAARSKIGLAFGKADPVPGNEETGSDHLDAMSPQEREQHARGSAGSLPGAVPDWSNPALADQEADDWKVTVAVSQEDTAWMNNVNALKAAAFHKLRTSPLKMIKAITSGGGEEYLSRKVLQYQGKLDGQDEAEQQKLIEDFTGGLHSVGHTWIRLSSYVKGQLKDLYSYGMWPQKLYDPDRDGNVGGYAGFAAPGPGQIRHPDTVHEGDPTKAYMDYKISDEQFVHGLARANDLFDSPPPYVLIGYNCTAFAREILGATGQSYPGHGVLPGVAYTPGNLYWSIMKEWAKGHEGAHTNDAHADIVEQINEKTEGRAESFKHTAIQAVLGIDKNAPRETIQLYAGNELKYKEHPGESSWDYMDLDRDVTAQYVNDRGFITQHNLVPVDIGGRTIYAKYSTLMAASVAGRKAPEESGSGGRSRSGSGSESRPGGKLQVYMVNNEDLFAWEEVSQADAALVKPTGHSDVENMAPAWRSKHPGVEAIEVELRGSYMWVLKSEYDAFVSAGSAPPQARQLQLYTAGSDKNLHPAETLGGGMLPMTGGNDQNSGYLIRAWLESHPGTEVVEVLFQGDMRWVIKSEYQAFISGPPSSGPTGVGSNVVSAPQESGRVEESSESRSRSSSVSSDEDFDDLDDTVEVGGQPAKEEMHEELRQFSDLAWLMMRADKDIANAVPNYAYEKDFQNLSDGARVQLAKMLGITIEELTRQIEAL